MQFTIGFFEDYLTGISAGDFYNEPIGDDFIYPDLSWILRIITPDYLSL